MYHDLPRAARFWSFLLMIDQDLAEETRKKACPCGGRLHSSNYLRKPRGTLLRLPEAQCVRLVFDSSSSVFAVSPFVMDRDPSSSWNHGATCDHLLALNR